MTRDRWLLWGSVSFLIGIALYPYCRVEAWICLLLLGVLMALLFLLTQEKARLLAFLFSCLLAGFVRFDLCPSMAESEKETEAFIGKKVKLSCQVSGIPTVKNGKQQIVLRVLDPEFPAGKILVFADAYAHFDHGERVALEGTLKRPESFQDFDYRRYLFQKGIYFISYRPELTKRQEEKGILALIYDLREKADRNLKRIMPSPQGNLLSAMTLGVNSDEIQGAMDAFNRTGTSHVIVVSGSHLVIVIALLLYLLLGLNLNRRHIFYPVLLGIAAFILLSGSGASAVRSGIMAFLFLLAVRIGRAKKASTALIFSAAVMVFVNPFVLAGDVSFQLSFLAVFGLVYLVPPLTRWTARWPGGGMKEMLVATFCAQLATLPVIAANFGQFSILSFLANILILPTVPFVMVSGFILVGASFLSPALAAVLSWPAYLILSYYLAVVGWLAGTDIGLIKF